MSDQISDKTLKMSDQISDKTLDSSSSSSSSLLDQPPPDSSSSSSTTTNSSAIDAALSLTRNSSLSKLNAKAPEFVPKKPPTPPLTPPLPTAAGGGDPRVVIAPPPPPPPPAVVHVYPPPLSPSPPPPQVNSPFPVMPLPSTHLPHHPTPHHHRSNDHHHHHRSNDLRNDHHRSNDHHRKHHQRGSNGEQSEGVGHHHHQQDKENNSNAVSKNNNGLSDESTLKLINQVEYYFSDVNLATTDHLIRFINKDPEGFVPISVVSSFKKIKALISSNSQLAAVLRNSTKLVVSEDGKKVKRLHPLKDMEELQARIIVAENLPEDHCHQNLMKVFSAVGSVKSIRTCQPQPSNNGASSASRQSKNDNALYCNKVHAFVEYETIELAEKAIAELNDEGDWRNGLRIRSLLKQGSKTAQARGKKSGNEGEVTCEEEDASTSEQNLNEKQSEDLSGQPDVHTNEHGEEQSIEKEGGQKKSRNRGRGKGRGRGQQNHHNHHQNNRGHHVGSPPINHAMNGEHPIVAKQHPPGPRMPDGTRGFSMGRGRPVAVNTTA